MIQSINGGSFNYSFYLRVTSHTAESSLGYITFPVQLLSGPGNFIGCSSSIAFSLIGLCLEDELYLLNDKR